VGMLIDHVPVLSADAPQAMRASATDSMMIGMEAGHSQRSHSSRQQFQAE